VEALFEGGEEVVASVVALCRQGPPLALVDDVLEETAHPDELSLRRVGERFSVLPTV
jgi:acylphosphatase